MTATALYCGNIDRSVHRDGDDVRWVEVSPLPDRTEVDPVLADLGGRLLVHGSDAALAAVLVRLLRKELLGTVEVGYLPSADSPASRLWNLPMGAAALDLARTGVASPAALVRDDSGGVLVGSAVIAPITGQVYCDDEQVLSGSAQRVEITPDPSATPLPRPTNDPLSTTLEPATDGLRVITTRRRMLRTRREVTRGRAVQAGFRSATVLRDGVEHPRPATKWGWYRHTEDLLLVRP